MTAKLVMAIAIVCVYLSGKSMAQPSGTLIVKTNEPIAEIQPTMWGLFFEDINMGADGGIYAELVKNRSFEFDTPMMGWSVLKEKESQTNGKALIYNAELTNPANRRYIRITTSEDARNFGISNEGFRGMGIKEGNQYDFSVVARQ